MKEVVFVVEVNSSWQACAAWFQLIRFLGMHQGKKMKITAKPVKRVRSLNQNAFYWGCVVPVIQEMFQESGNDCDPETVHIYLKMHVGGFIKKLKEPSGRERWVPSSSTQLETHEFEVWMEKIRCFAAEWGHSVPFPNEET